MPATLALASPTGGRGASALAVATARTLAERGPTLLVAPTLADADDLAAIAGAPRGPESTAEPVALADRLDLAALKGNAEQGAPRLVVIADTRYGADRYAYVVADLGRHPRAADKIGATLAVACIGVDYVSLRAAIRTDHAGAPWHAGYDAAVWLRTGAGPLTVADAEAVVPLAGVAHVAASPSIARAVDAGTVLGRPPVDLAVPALALADALSVEPARR